jgi:hypothetical protein
LGVLCLNEGEDSVRQCIEDRIAPPRQPAAEAEQVVDEL